MDLEREHRIYKIVLQAQQQQPSRLEHFLNQICLGDRELCEEVKTRLEGIEVVTTNAKKLLGRNVTDST